MNEPHDTALLLLATGVLLALSALFSRPSGRFGIPFALVFLAIGMVAGSDGLGLAYHNYSVAFRIGSAALVLILFDGGLNTSISQVRFAAKPAVVLATVGVVGTAVLVAGGARLWGVPWDHALLIGAVVSSTDAAAVFGVLRGSGLQLQRRVGVTLELESGINDPMAIILTMTLTQALVGGDSLSWTVLPTVALQLALGTGFGFALGYGGRWLLGRTRLPAGGLYSVVTLAIAFISFGLTTLAQGSGFLAVYVTGLVLGNGALPLRTGLLRVHDSLAWVAQVSMFLLLGLLVFPTRLIHSAGLGLTLALGLAFIARPLVVALCLAPFRFPLKETLYVGWVGLRGAVPIILATYPVLLQAPGAEKVFDVVFFIVVVNAIIPGSTVRWVTRLLGLEFHGPPPSQAVLEIASMQTLDGDVLSFFIDKSTSVANAQISEIPFPEGASIMLVVRGNTLVAARGATFLLPGDHVYVFCKPVDSVFVRLLFGQEDD